MAHKYSNRDRQLLAQRISELGPTEHKEIYGILNTHSVEYTRNSNGVFVNMTTLPDVILSIIEQFVSFCHDNKLILDEYDKRLSECKFNSNRYENRPSVMGTTNVVDDNTEHVPSVVPPPLMTMTTTSVYKQSLKRFSRRRVMDATEDTATTELLIPEPVILHPK